VNYALKRVIQAPPLTFEERLARAFRGSEWVPNLEPDVGPSPPLEADVGPAPAAPPAVAVIGGAKFDRESLRAWIASLPRDTLLITGEGRFRKDGSAMDAEATVRLMGTDLGVRVDVVELREDLYRNKAVDAQIERICTLTAGDIILVGTGGRPNKARDWWHRMNLHERDDRQALVKRSGEYISHRSPENRRGLQEIAKEST
jgi:hypothetical protein